MSWIAWALLARLAVSTIAAVAKIGRPRKPVTREEAIAALIVNGLLAWAIVELAT